VAKVALDEALGARRCCSVGELRVARRAVAIPSGELADSETLPKYVVSSTLEIPLEQLDGPNGRRGRRGRKAHGRPRRGNVVPASFQLVHTLIEHDLVDELRLKIFPVVLGAGERLFGETSDKKPMRLVDTQTLGDGVAFLTYELVRENA
jgi:hypothetical protein